MNEYGQNYLPYRIPLFSMARSNLEVNQIVCRRPFGKCPWQDNIQRDVCSPPHIEKIGGGIYSTVKYSICAHRHLLCRSGGQKSGIISIVSLKTFGFLDELVHCVSALEIPRP